MRYKLLGHSGLRVSEVCLGTMTFGETWGWGASLSESKKMFDLFTEAGGNFIDTSVNYTDGSAEEFLGDFLKADRDHFVIATKYTLTKPDNPDPDGGGNSRKNMMKSVERSLKYLKTDHIDLYYLHMWDYMTPVEEVVRGLDDLIRQGLRRRHHLLPPSSVFNSRAHRSASVNAFQQHVRVTPPESVGRRIPPPCDRREGGARQQQSEGCEPPDESTSHGGALRKPA